MHRDSKIIFENYESGVQNRVTANFGSSEVIEGFAKVFANLDKAEIVSLTKCLKEMLPSDELVQLLGGLARHPGLKGKMPEIREAGKMFGEYQKETESGRYAPYQLEQ